MNDGEEPGFIACSFGVTGFVLVVLLFAALLGALGFAAFIVVAAIFVVGFVLYFLFNLIASIFHAIFD